MQAHISTLTLLVSIVITIKARVLHQQVCNSSRAAAMVLDPVVVWIELRISAQLIHQCELEIGHHIAGHMCANARSRCAKRNKRIILGNEHHV